MAILMFDFTFCGKTYNFLSYNSYTRLFNSRYLKYYYYSLEQELKQKRVGFTTELLKKLDIFSSPVVGIGTTLVLLVKLLITTEQ